MVNPLNVRTIYPVATEYNSFLQLHLHSNSCLPYLILTFGNEFLRLDLSPFFLFGPHVMYCLTLYKRSKIFSVRCPKEKWCGIHACTIRFNTCYSSSCLQFPPTETPLHLKKCFSSSFLDFLAFCSEGKHVECHLWSKLFGKIPIYSLIRLFSSHCCFNIPALTTFTTILFTREVIMQVCHSDQ